MFDIPLPLAVPMAISSVPRPTEAELVTVIVASTTRSSSRSAHGLKRGPLGTRPTATVRAKVVDLGFNAVCHLKNVIAEAPL